MGQARRHIWQVKHVLLIWLMLFALTPCVIKETLFGGASPEFETPKNKSRATVAASLCSYLLNDKQQSSVSVNANIDPKTEHFLSMGNSFFVIRTQRIGAHISGTYSGNSPPKYILFKRLRLDVLA